ncbi:transcription antitermination factor NusB [Mariniluteicoccus flavus]
MPAGELPELELIGPAPGQGPARNHSTRTKARMRALDMLFEADLKGVSARQILAEREAGEHPVREFTHELVVGVCDHLGALDRAIADSLASGWTLERMPRVDRNACRVAAYELLHTDIDVRIAVSEAVAIVEELSTDDSPAFVNGVLAKIATQRG